MSRPVYLDERPLRLRLAVLRFVEAPERRLVDDAAFRLVVPRREVVVRFAEADFRFDEPAVRFDDADFRFEDDALFRFDDDALFRFEDDALFRFDPPLREAVLRFVALPLRDAVFRFVAPLDEDVLRFAAPLEADVFRFVELRAALVFRFDAERVFDADLVFEVARDFVLDDFDRALDVFDERLDALFVLREPADLRELVDLREDDVFRRAPPRVPEAVLAPEARPLPLAPSSEESSSSSDPINFFATPTAAGIATPSAVPATTFCVVESPSSSSFDMVTSCTPSPSAAHCVIWRR